MIHIRVPSCKHYSTLSNTSPSTGCLAHEERTLPPNAHAHPTRPPPRHPHPPPHPPARTAPATTPAAHQSSPGVGWGGNAKLQGKSSRPTGFPSAFAAGHEVHNGTAALQALSMCSDLEEVRGQSRGNRSAHGLRQHQGHNSTSF